MPVRTAWQYCQIEQGPGNTGTLKQFFPDRAPVETQLHQNWPAMLAKLGDQGWELVNVVAHEGGLGRRALTYVFKRPVGSGSGGSAPAPASGPPTPPEPEPPPTDFEPLRGA